MNEKDPTLSEVLRAVTNGFSAIEDRISSVRTELKEDIAGVEARLSAEIAGVRADVVSVRQDVAELKARALRWKRMTSSAG